MPTLDLVDDTTSVTWRRQWPLGWLVLRATRLGLSELRIASSGDGIGDALDAFLSPEEVVSENPIVRQANLALDAYLDGDFDAFEDVPIYFSSRPSFGRKVLEALREVRGGELITYGGLAAVAGSPYAARAVGGAVGSNPIMIAVPCHRVVAADGSLGGFSGGLGVKRWLLAHERVAARPGGWENRRRPVS